MGDPAELDDDPAVAPPPKADTFDRVMKVFYSAVVAVEVAYVADVLTHGAVSRAVEPFYWRARTALTSTVAGWQREREIRRAERHVYWAAVEALEEGAAS